MTGWLERFLELLIEQEIAEPIARAEGWTHFEYAARMLDLTEKRRRLIREAAKGRHGHNALRMYDPSRLPQ